MLDLNVPEESSLHVMVTVRDVSERLKVKEIMRSKAEVKSAVTVICLIKNVHNNGLLCIWP